MCAQATQSGVCFYDTSEAFGHENQGANASSEHLVGRTAFAQEPAGRPVVVASKYFAAPWAAAFSSSKLGSLSMEAALDGTLARLTREAVDVYVVHQPVPAMKAQVRTFAQPASIERYHLPNPLRNNPHTLPG